MKYNLNQEEYSMNAIILAAGMGTRLRPLTDNTAKPLVKVNGEPMIERQIRYLREIGIEEIVVVTGYLHKEFDYLESEFDVTLVHNDKYDVYNNGYTMYIVRDYLHDTYVLEGDIYLTNNFLRNDLESSTYFTGIKEDFESEWILNHNSENELTHISIGQGTDYITSGVSYWIDKDSEILKEKLEELVASNGFENLFWDDIIRNNVKDFKIKINKIKSTDWFEIDSMNDFKIAEEFTNKNK